MLFETTNSGESPRATGVAGYDYIVVASTLGDEAIQAKRVGSVHNFDIPSHLIHLQTLTPTPSLPLLPLLPLLLLLLLILLSVLLSVLLLLLLILSSLININIKWLCVHFFFFLGVWGGGFILTLTPPVVSRSYDVTAGLKKSLI